MAGTASLASCQGHHDIDNNWTQLINSLSFKWIDRWKKIQYSKSNLLGYSPVQQSWVSPLTCYVVPFVHLDILQKTASGSRTLISVEHLSRAKRALGTTRREVAGLADTSIHRRCHRNEKAHASYSNWEDSEKPGTSAIWFHWLQHFTYDGTKVETCNRLYHPLFMTTTAKIMFDRAEFIQFMTVC